MKDFKLDFSISPVITYFIIINHFLLLIVAIFCISFYDNGRFESLTSSILPLINSAVAFTFILALFFILNVGFSVYKGIKKHRKNKDKL